MNAQGCPSACIYRADQAGSRATTEFDSVLYPVWDHTGSPDIGTELFWEQVRNSRPRTLIVCCCKKGSCLMCTQLPMQATRLHLEHVGWAGKGGVQAQAGQYEEGVGE
jgi:hypothetical protein